MWKQTLLHEDRDEIHFHSVLFQMYVSNLQPRLGLKTMWTFRELCNYCKPFHTKSVAIPKHLLLFLI